MAAINDLDSVFRLLGRPGRYHVLVYLMLCCNIFPVVMNHLVMAIYGARTLYSCSTPSSNSTMQNTEISATECHVTYKNISANVTTLVSECTDGWDFQLNKRETNIISEWSLVCDHKYLTSLATTIYFSGVMVGGLIFGSLSDRWGRKPFILLTLYTHVVVGTALAFANSYPLFVVLRFAQGMLMQGLQTSTCVLIMELFTPEHRTAVGTIFEIFWGTGVMWLALVSYLLQNWRYIQLAITLPSVITIVYIWTIPESVRWLVAKHRFKDAEKILHHAAKFNAVELPLDPLEAKRKSLQEINHQLSVTSNRYTIFDVFRMSQLCKRSVILFYVWLVGSISYYGLSLSITMLSGNRYLNLFIAGLVELPAYCAAVFIIGRFGRRRPLAAYLFIGGLFCITAGLLPKETASGTDLRMVSTGLAMLGRFGMAGCFSVIFLYSCELYPTVIRNVCMGACAFWARVGGILAPQLVLLGQYGFSWLPVVILGSMSLLGGALTLLLPETLNTTLPDTLEQAEQIKKQIVPMLPADPRTRTQSIRSMTDADLMEESAQTETFM